MQSNALKLEPFVTAKEVIDSGLFPGLTPEMLRHFVRQGVFKAYGPKHEKTYLLSELHQDWLNIKRINDNGRIQVQERAKKVCGGLPKAWKTV